jgi:hypothetical protein
LFGPLYFYPAVKYQRQIYKTVYLISHFSEWLKRYISIGEDWCYTHFTQFYVVGSKCGISFHQYYCNYSNILEILKGYKSWYQKNCLINSGVQGINDAFHIVNKVEFSDTLSTLLTMWNTLFMPCTPEYVYENYWATEYLFKQQTYVDWLRKRHF